MTPKELAETTGMSAAAMTTMIDRLLTSRRMKEAAAAVSFALGLDE